MYLSYLFICPNYEKQNSLVIVLAYIYELFVLPK